MATKTDIELKIVDSVDTSHSDAEVLADSASNPDAFYVGRGYLAKGGEKVIESIDEKGTYPNVTVGNATKATTATTADKATKDGSGKNIAENYALISDTVGKLGVLNSPDDRSAVIPNSITNLWSIDNTMFSVVIYERSSSSASWVEKWASDSATTEQKANIEKGSSSSILHTSTRGSQVRIVVTAPSYRYVKAVGLYLVTKDGTYSGNIDYTAASYYENTISESNSGSLGSWGNFYSAPFFTRSATSVEFIFNTGGANAIIQVKGYRIATANANNPVFVGKALKAYEADKATTADSATHADSADSAAIANSAMKAEYATNAGNAERAKIANSAESAKSAASASTAALAINLQNAPELTTENEQIVVKVGDKTSNALTVPYAQHADFAADLSGRVEATPEEFTYRPSAGDKSIKDDNAFIRRVKGNSVVWNQIAKEINSANWGVYNSNNASISFNSNIATVTVTNYASDIYGYNIGARLTSAVPTVPNHKYLIAAEIKSDIAMLFGLELNSKYTEIGFVTNEWTYCANIETSNRTVTTLNISPRYPFTAELNTYSFRNLICIDLTAMFGTGNEPTTVEEFRALYPNSYYPYNTGELRNLVCSGIKTVGFNLFDEDVMTSWQGITKDNRGWYGNVSSFYQDSSNNRNKLWVNTMGYTGQICVYIKSTAVDTQTNFRPEIHYTDGTTNSYDGSVVLSKEKTSAEGYIVSDENKVVDFVYFTYGRIGYVIVNNFCINLHHTGYRDGEYEPYKEVTNELPLSQITNGEPLRKAGSVYDEINETEYIRRVGVRGYATGDKDDATLLTDGRYTNYPLAEPIVTPIETPIDFNYYVEDFGTEEAILAENSAPFSADIIYQFNATDQVRNNSRNIQRLKKSVFTPSGSTTQYIRGDGSYGDMAELSSVIPINNGEFELPDGGDYDRQFILTPNYYAKSPVELDNTATVAVYVTPTDTNSVLAEYWFEFTTADTLPEITFISSNVYAKFRIGGEMITDAVNILHLISSDGGATFFGEIKNYTR